MNHTINFGIDLGTTNSAIAYYDAGEVTVFKNPRTLKQTIPSVVAFKGDRILIGEKAAELLTKDTADVFGGFKRRMGSMDRFRIESMKRETSPIELSSIVLKELKNFLVNIEIPDAVVITIPAAFDTNQSNATKEAGYQAGFKEVILLQEPVAASLAYANQKKASIEEGKWIVYDFGGGTFDVALTGILDDEMEILDHEGDNFLGGKDIDRDIVEQFVIPELEKKGVFTSLLTKMRNTDGEYHRLYNKLLYLCEEAKIMLSSTEQTDIEFDVRDEQGKNLDIYLKLTRQKLEEIAMPYINHSLRLMDELFRRNGIGRDDLKCILLVGGTTYIPAVRKALADKYQVEINTSVDPTTAVVVGAAYFAGQRVKSISKVDSSDRSAVENKLQVHTAYERLVRSDDTTLLIRIHQDPKGCLGRISRLDGGYDSGNMILSSAVNVTLPLLPNVYNEFDFTVTDASGAIVYRERIGITHGKFSIHGQTLPHPIGIEVDDSESGSTYLEVVFKKNAILPLRRTLVKKVAETISKNSANEIFINVYEGDIDSIPQANKRIGTIVISGKELQRDLVKGSDIELTLEISESRDVKAGAYLVLTDQQFENTFSPSEIQFNAKQILTTTQYFKENLLKKRIDSERHGKYETAAEIQHILKEINDLDLVLKNFDVKDESDEKYQLEIKAREIGRKIHNLFNTSILTKVIEEYYKAKGTMRYVLLESNQKELDRAEYLETIASEREFLQEGNITVIKMRTAQLQAIMSRVYRTIKITDEDIKYAYINYKNKDYADMDKASQLIKTGDHAVSQNDIIKLHEVINDLDRLLKQESRDQDYFKNRKTGLE